MPRTEITPTTHPIYSNKDSLGEAVDYIQGQLPITDPNKLFALLMLYQNTVLHIKGLKHEH
jgi:hypothetical protein